MNRLLNGGVDSSIGRSSNAASNLVIQGSTLKYAGTGSNGTTDRLFTVGTGGATLDASGASGSALNFTNTSALAMGLAAPQAARMSDTGTNVSDGIANNINTQTRVNLVNGTVNGSVDDIVAGMTFSGTRTVVVPTSLSIRSPP